MSIETGFDTTLIASLASQEKQIQQTYRPIIGIHKWFARRPGTLFRGLLLAEFAHRPLSQCFFEGNRFEDKLVADPFMGGGTPLIEANRLGMRVIGSDINPMAYWTVRQSLAPLDLQVFRAEAERIAGIVEETVGKLYKTTCTVCGSDTATVKYFLWVKQYRCKGCGEPNDLFPGYLIATNDRHTAFVWYCPACEQLAEIQRPPGEKHTVPCPNCGHELPYRGIAQRGEYRCKACHKTNLYPNDQVPQHRMIAIEYHCESCRSQHRGRYFKAPDETDRARFAAAQASLHASGDTGIPDDEIPAGDETNRLLRWGYRRYRDLFNDRQLFGLQALFKGIISVEPTETRYALATVFSDMLRYQNMLCRYDTMALKCQDIFSVHGFPVGLVQCENNLLGIPGVGSGGFRHFVEKYVRAKEYGAAPYEIVRHGGRKRQLRTSGERIEAVFTRSLEVNGRRSAYLVAADSSTLEVAPESLDAVFTDPPYFANVQYAELMDFCYVWLRQILGQDETMFTKATTRNERELTGNETLRRGLLEFTEGLSAVFVKMARGLKQRAPLVFTYHHNKPDAYVPLIVAILDAGLTCTATLASPAEMSASMHINGTNSSTIDSVFVCRKGVSYQEVTPSLFPDCVKTDIDALHRAGLRVTKGDVMCLSFGHLSRIAMQRLSPCWYPGVSTKERLELAGQALTTLIETYSPEALAASVAGKGRVQVTLTEV